MLVEKAFDSPVEWFFWILLINIYVQLCNWTYVPLGRQTQQCEAYNSYTVNGKVEPKTIQIKVICNVYCSYFPRKFSEQAKSTLDHMCVKVSISLSPQLVTKSNGLKFHLFYPRTPLPHTQRFNCYSKSSISHHIVLYFMTKMGFHLNFRVLPALHAVFAEGNLIGKPKWELSVWR